MRFKTFDLPQGLNFSLQFHNYPTQQAENLHLLLYETYHDEFSNKYRDVTMWTHFIHWVYSSLSLLILKKKVKNTLCGILLVFILSIIFRNDEFIPFLYT